MTYEHYVQQLIDASKHGQNPIVAVWENYSTLIKPKWNSKFEVLFPDAISTLEILKTKYKLGIIANQSDGLIKP